MTLLAALFVGTFWNAQAQTVLIGRDLRAIYRKVPDQVLGEAPSRPDSGDQQTRVPARIVLEVFDPLILKRDLLDLARQEIRPMDRRTIYFSASMSTFAKLWWVHGKARRFEVPASAGLLARVFTDPKEDAVLLRDRLIALKATESALLEQQVETPDDFDSDRLAEVQAELTRHSEWENFQVLFDEWVQEMSGTEPVAVLQSKARGTVGFEFGRWLAQLPSDRSRLPVSANLADFFFCSTLRTGNYTGVWELFHVQARSDGHYWVEFDGTQVGTAVNVVSDPR